MRFRWKDYTGGNRVKTMALPAEGFLQRFLLHVLAAVASEAPAAPEPVAALVLRVTGIDLTRCPVCRLGRLQIVGRLRPGALPVPVWDTS